jgi:hypothetical protein
LNIIPSQTKFAIPYLLCIPGHCIRFFSYLAVFVEDSLTFGTEDRVTGSKLTPLFKAAHRNLKNIGVDLLLVLSCLFSFLLWHSTEIGCLLLELVYLEASEWGRFWARKREPKNYLTFEG